jgi:hypothetical protein
MKDHQKSEMAISTMLVTIALVACGGGTKIVTNTVTEVFPIYLVATEGLSFEPIHDRCDKAVRHFCIENHATTNLHLAKLELVEKNEDTSFFFGAIDQGLTPETVQGQVLEPASRFCFDVEHRPSKPGAHNASISAQLVELDSPLLLEIGGGADFMAEQIDRYFQGPSIKVDFLIVVDKSMKMSSVRQLAHDRLTSLFSQIEQRADYHVGVISMEDSEGGQLHPLNGVDPRVVHSALPHPEQNFAAMIDDLNIGTGSTDEGLTSTFLMLQSGGFGVDFFRDDAIFFILYVSDTDDTSQSDPTLFAWFFRTARDALRMTRLPINPNVPMQSVVAFGILPQVGDTQCLPPLGAMDFGTRYAQACSLSGGFTISFCSTDWSQVLQFFPPPGPYQELDLSRTPMPDSIKVSIKQPDGSMMMLTTQDWMYDSDRHAVLLNALPPAASTVEVTYETQCP